MRHGLITLTTDFGESDWFVGTMKGVILAINPRITLVDITHGIPAGDVWAGAFALRESCRCFPPGTIHVAVVDPGVGSERRAVAVRTRDQIFVAPDNGLLALALATQTIRGIRQLSNPRWFRHPVSRTFHGRDIFAPVAAHLSRGLRWSELGEAGADYVRLRWPEPVARRGVVLGEIVYLDRFGNGITNLDAPTLGGAVTAGIVRLGRRMVGPVQTCYASVAPGAAVAVIGSSGLLEIAVNGGSAAQRFRLRVGDPVSVVGAPAVASPGRM
jgi:hypothetical protein